MQGAEEPTAPGSKTPFPRVLSGGPAARVKSIAFLNSGQTLLAAGWDKAVYRWDQADVNWQSRPEGTLVFPLGGGLDGILEAMAVSPDEQWLAVGGRGVKRGVSDSQQSGVETSAANLTDAQRLDEGTIYVVHLPTGGVKLLRGHRGAVLGLRFASGNANLLVSAAEGWDDATRQFQTELRGWDVANAQELGKLTSFSNGNRTRPLPPWDGLAKMPGVAAFSNPDGKLLVVLAWPDNNQEFGLRLWDVSQGTTTKLDTTNKHFYFDVDIDPANPGDLLTCSGNQAPGDARNSNGEFMRWSGFIGNNQAGGTPQLIHDFGKNRIPLELVIQKVEQGSSAAVVLMEWAQNQPSLVGLSGQGDRWTQTTQTALKTSFAPAAISSAGTVAWSTLEEPGIRVRSDFSNEQSQIVLQSSASSFQNVEFVTQEGRLGLRLKPRNPSLNTVVFDPTNRSLVADTQEWQSHVLESSIPIEAQLETNGQNRQILVVNVKLPSGARRLEIVPADPEAPISPQFLVKLVNIQPENPRVVVAYNQKSEPFLQVYDLNSGDKLREYSAHTGSIRDFSIQKDGRLLASVSSDSTVRIWWLGDLIHQQEFPGAFRQGQRSLKFASRTDGPLTVASPIEPLQAGDTILAIDIGSGPQKVSTPHECQQWAHRAKAGSEVRIETGRGPVVVRLGRAVDIQREVLAIVARTSSDGPGHWIAWHPSGVFDFHGDAKTWLHWHFNTGDAQHPAQIVQADKYDQEFLRNDFLIPLLETGKVPKAKPVDPPKLSILIQDANGDLLENTEHGHPLIRTLSDLRSVEVQVDSRFPLNRIDGIHWSLSAADGQVLIEGDAVSGPNRTWTFEPAPQSIGAGMYSLVANVLTGGQLHPTWKISQDIRFQPPAPTMELGELPTTVAVGKLPLTIGVNSTEPAILRIVSRPGTEPIEKAIDSGKSKIDVEVPLELGRNDIEVTLTNRQALSGYEALEQDRKRLSLFRAETPPPQGKYQLTQWNLDLYSSMADLTSGQGIIRTKKKDAHLLGTMSGPDKPMVKLDINGKSHAVQVTGEGPYELDCHAILELGENPLTLQIGDQILSTAVVAYAPKIPELGALAAVRVNVGDASLANQRPTGELVDGLHSPRVHVSVETLEPGEISKLKGSVVIDGKAIAEIPIQIESLSDGRSRFTAEVELSPGQHSLQFRLSNPWESQTSDAVQLQRIIPPRIKQFVFTGQDGPLVRVKMEFEKSQSMPLRGDLIRISVNEKLVSVKSNLKIEQGQDQITALLEVPGEPGTKNIVAGWIEQDSQPLISPASFEVQIPELPGQRPDIEIHPSASETYSSNVDVTLTINTEVPLKSLQIGSSINQLSKIVGSDVEGKIGRFQTVRLVNLSPGVNEIVVVASNRWGETQETVTVSQIEKPIDRGDIVFHSGENRQTITFTANDRHLKQAAKDSFNEIHVTLNTLEQALNPGEDDVQVWVNGFLQSTGKLTQTGDGSYHADLDVLLNLTTKNYVEVEFPNLKSTHDFRRDFTVDCENPTVEQELHVILFDARSTTELADASDEELEKYKDHLRERMNNALQAERNGGLTVHSGPGTRVQQVYSSEAFRRIDEEVFVGGAARWMNLRRKLQGLTSNVSSRKDPRRYDRRTTRMNPVLLLYYRGQEVDLDPTLKWGSFGLSTAESGTTPNENKMITEGALAELLPQISGAHLLILDLESSNRRSVPNLVQDSRLGVFRHVQAQKQPGNSMIDHLTSALGENQGGRRYLKDVRDILRKQIAPTGSTAELHVPFSLERLRLVTKPE